MTTVDPETARRAARDLLDRPEFARPGEGVISRAQRWLAARFGDAISALGGSGAGSVIASILVIGSLVGIGFLVVRFLRTRGRPRRAAAVVDVDVIVSQAVDPVSWRVLADEHRRAGRWRDAVRCRYRAVIADLADRRLVIDTPGSTSGELRDAVESARPTVAVSMEEFTGRFDAAWYSDLPLSSEDDDEARRLDDDVMGRIR
jgi:hypothetical protein